MRGIIDFLVLKLGYLTVIHMKDTILFISGISAGGILMTFLIGIFFYRLRDIDVSEKVIALSVKCKGEPIYFAKPKTYTEAVQIVLFLAIIPLFKNYAYRIKNTVWSNIFFHLILCLAVALIILGYVFINNTILPPELINSL